MQFLLSTDSTLKLKAPRIHRVRGAILARTSGAIRVAIAPYELRDLLSRIVAASGSLILGRHVTPASIGQEHLNVIFARKHRRKLADTLAFAIEQYRFRENFLQRFSRRIAVVVFGKNGDQLNVCLCGARLPSGHT